jgi:hypothetical protein
MSIFKDKIHNVASKMKSFGKKHNDKYTDHKMHVVMKGKSYQDFLNKTKDHPPKNSCHEGKGGKPCDTCKKYLKDNASSIAQSQRSQRLSPRSYDLDNAGSKSNLEY